MRKNTSNLRFDLLTAAQKQIFSDLGKIVPNGILGGGTAIMLLLGHRKSFDFDVFLKTSIKKQFLVGLKTFFGAKLQRPLVDSADELSLQIMSDIKLSFIYFPFKPLHHLIATDSISLFTKEDLASNKAYVIGRRGAWRDYVDFFCLLNSGLNFSKVIDDAKKRFSGAFSEKLLLAQLTYFGDITDFTVEYVGRDYKPKEIQEYFEKLVKKHLSS